MSKYQVIILPAAQRQLNKLPDQIAIVLVQSIQHLSVNPRPAGYIKLKGRSGYRIREGNYRIIYEIHDRQVRIDIVAVGDRKDVYDL
ncbi:MAG: type II toxin-antitoxin system RelE family toxin [Flavobacteriales bacterium]